MGTSEVITPSWHIDSNKSLKQPSARSSGTARPAQENREGMLHNQFKFINLRCDEIETSAFSPLDLHPYWF
jgi:hypothetical protein